MSHVQLFRTLDLSEEQTSLDFSSGGFSRNGRRYRTEDLKVCVFKGWFIMQNLTRGRADLVCAI